MNEFHDEIGLQHSKSLISNMGRRQDSLIHDDDSSGTEEDEDEIRLVFPNNESTRNPSKFNLQLFQSKASFRKHKWNEKIKPDLSNFLSEQEDLEQFQSLYAAGLTSYKYLYSLGYIIWSNKSQLQEVCTNYNENLQVVASYLVRRTHKRDLKLHALRTLMMCLSPLEASWQVCDPVIEGTLDYLLGEVQWEFMEHTQMDLILELRAICLGQIERERQRVARVGRTGDIVAVLISAGAKIIEAGIQSSESILSNQLEAAGDQLKRTVRPQAHPLCMDRDAIVALCWSDAAKRASASAKIGSRKAVVKLRDVSNRGLEAVADQLAKENSALEQKLPPEGAEALRAIGKVGMASLGAAAVVGEALVESSRVVFKKTSVVTADLVEHKYGTSAGQVVSDAGETADNLIRTVGNVAVLDKNALARATARSVGTTQVNSDLSKAKDSLHLLEIQAAGMINQALQIDSTGGGQNALLGAKSQSLSRYKLGTDTQRYKAQTCCRQ